MRLKLRHRERPSLGYREWRQQCLREAGFDRMLAARLSSDTRFDLHALLELVDTGCPPALAARILAPLGVEARG